MNAKFSKRVITDTPLELHFHTDTTEECILSRHPVLVTAVRIQNTGFGVRYRAMKVTIVSDTAGVQLCVHRNIAACVTGAGSIEFLHPAIPQMYWRGAEKTFVSRVCVPVDFPNDDFNIDFAIECEPTTRDLDGQDPANLVIHNNLHVRIHEAATRE
jgi:hypothetical protein